MKIFLVRHGESTGDVEDRFGGTYDDHLSARGHEQAQALAEKLSGKDIEIIFSSPYHRAREVAEIVSRAVEAPVEFLGALREHDVYGLMSGMVKAEAKALHPEEFAKVGNRNEVVTGAEPYRVFQQRMEKIFRHLAGRDQATIAIVTHGGQIRAFSRHLIGKEPQAIGDCAILEIETDGLVFHLVTSENFEVETT